MAVAFARRKFSVFTGSKTVIIPIGKCDSYKRKLQNFFQSNIGNACSFVIERFHSSYANCIEEYANLLEKKKVFT